MFIDELKLNLKAGRGGDGVVRWLHLKGKEFSGPAGGNGGRGGNVVVKAVRDLGALEKYRDQKDYNAENGAPGGNHSKEGKNGEDLVLEFPIGSVVTNLDTDKKVELLEEGQEEIILEGGNGGYGNEHFKGSRNVTPKQSTKGKPGETGSFYVELQLVVDAGFIGMPNAGKSSLLNELTGAHAKVGAYAFTTLNPNLGVLYGYVLADIPGLIEGASKGKGLGHTFLRHVKRTKMLVHCISCEEENPAEIYKAIRNELSDYSEELKNKQEIVLFTKTDLLEKDELDERKKNFAKEVGVDEGDILSTSIYDDASLKAFSDALTKKMGELKSS